MDNETFHRIAEIEREIAVLPAGCITTCVFNLAE